MHNHPPCKIFLVRHGETEWNVQQRLQGEKDIPLNENGKQQARSLLEKFSHVIFDAAYSSDLERAFETAEIVLSRHQIPIHKTRDLRETKLGRWEGVTVTDYRQWLKENNLLSQHLALQEFVTQKIGDDVESVAEVFQRASNFIRSRAPHHAGQTVLMTAHGGVINSIMNLLEFKQGHRWRASNCGWIELEVHADGTIHILNKNGVVQTEEVTVL